MVFDASKGGWVDSSSPKQPVLTQAIQRYESPSTGNAKHDKFNVHVSHTRHFEDRHMSPDWHLGMDKEIGLGLAPAHWSVSSAMDDQRPNGQALFDARFHQSAMGRARGGHSMVWSGAGVANSGPLKAAENWDSNAFATEMKEETAAGADSASKNQFGNNTNLSSFSGADLALAQMSALQRRQMDKDGDGQLSAEELRAHGFDTDLRVGNQ